MAFLIQETKNNCFYCGCYDYSEFGASFYMSFGSDFDAEWYYCLEHALKDVDFILKHETFWKPEELQIFNTSDMKNYSIEEARTLLKERGKKWD